ncbi:MAG: tRNA lysidine(34) synthetase TilS [Succinivibrio sp.]
MTEEEARAVVSGLADEILNRAAPRRLVCGISGGADSTLALLACLKAREKDPSIEVLAVHCIHGLDADDPVWLEHCKNLCRRLGAELETPRLHIVYGGGRSPEEASRAERYAALLSRLRGGMLVLGHQADDMEESFMLALKRGSGPKGLSGMEFMVRDSRGTILRPLLRLHKARIEEILNALSIPFVYDISNSYLKFERNFIRLKVLPLLRTRFAGIDTAILRSQRLCAQEHELAVAYASERMPEMTAQCAFALGGRALEASAVCNAPEALSGMVVRLYLEGYTELPPGSSVVEEVVRLCRASSDQNGVVKLGRLQVRRFRDLVMAVKDAPLPPCGTRSLRIGEEAVLGGYSYSLVPSSSADKAFRVPGGVELEFGAPGSTRLHPVWRGRSRELKKLFMECGVPYWERGAHPVVRSGGRVLALGGLFACMGAKDGQGGLFELQVKKTEG